MCILPRFRAGANAGLEYPRAPSILERKSYTDRLQEQQTQRHMPQTTSVPSTERSFTHMTRREMVPCAKRTALASREALEHQNRGQHER